MSIPILHIRSGFLVGGPEKLILSGITGMPGDRYSFILASFVLPQRPNNFLEYAASLGITTEPIAIGGSFDLQAISKTRDMIMRLAPKLVVAHDYRALVIALLAKRGTQIPLLAVAHGWTSQSFKVRVYEYIESKLLRFADAVVAVSRPRYAELGRLGIAANKLYLIENGVTLPAQDQRSRGVEFRRELGLDDQHVIIGSVGRLSVEKGHRVLIEAAARIRESCPQARFVLIGDGPLKSELKRLAAALGVRDNFLFPGWRSDMAAVYRTLDIFALPSFTEGLPMALLEAMSYSVPSVASSVGGCGDVIETGISGFLFRPGDSAALADHLTRLIVDKEFRIKIGAAGYQRILKQYSLERYVTQFDELYAGLMEGAGR